MISLISIGLTLAAGQTPAVDYTTGGMFGSYCYPTCTGTKGTDRMCTFTTVMDLFAASTGYYTFSECGTQANPTLVVERGVPTKFIQNDDTNWMHPLGFAYEPDGAHKSVNELEPALAGKATTAAAAGTDPDNCVGSEQCDAPMYFLGGGHEAAAAGASVYMAGADGDSTNDYRSNCQTAAEIGAATSTASCAGGGDFGLDGYEPLNFVTLERWQEYAPAGQGDNYVLVTILQTNTKEFFYFCHIHNWMSGRIKVVDTAATIPHTGELVPLGYDYETNTAFDTTCGTFNVGAYGPGGRYEELCANMKFTCAADEVLSASDKQFQVCLDALDCKMHYDMQVKQSEDIGLTFLQQMIPHHENAVNMAKLYLKQTQNGNNRKLTEDSTNQLLADVRRLGGYGSLDLSVLCHEIINVQNYQIMQMRDEIAAGPIGNAHGTGYQGGDGSATDPYIIDHGYGCAQTPMCGGGSAGGDTDITLNDEIDGGTVSLMLVAAIGAVSIVINLVLACVLFRQNARPAARAGGTAELEPKTSGRPSRV